MAMRNRSKLSVRKKTNAYNAIALCMLSGAIVFAAVMLSRKKEIAIVPSSQSTKIVAQFDTVQLPVPARKVMAGELGKEIPLTMVSYPRHQIPKGALHSLEQVLEASAVTDLPARLPLFRQNFSFTAHRSNPVMERIPKGMRAITLRVDVTSAVEGWAGSGARVDVLLVEKDRTTVVAENVNILSAERSVSPVAGSASPDIPSTVTVLVSQEQVLAINTAIPRGKIAFALRSLEDDESWSDRIFTAERLQRSPRRAARQEESITGYVSVKGEKGKHSFALSDGKWIRTKVIPKGYLVSKQKETSKQEEALARARVEHMITE